MKNLIIATFLACLCSGLVAADLTEASSENARDVATLRQQAQDLGDAMVAADVDQLKQIFADDWKAIGLSGKIATRESLIANVTSGKDKLHSFELGRMDVQVHGNVAAVHGIVTEKRSWDGKDTSGQFLWTDIVEKRGDKWVIVRSAGARVSR
jgi:ketosteroid isomerase-like protein